MVQKFFIDFENAGLEERYDLWSDIVRPFYFVSPIARDKSGPAMLSQAWLVDRLIFAEAKFGTQKTHRSKKHLISNPAEVLVVQSYRYGTTWGETDGEQTKRRPGEINITDYNREHRAFCEPTYVRCFIVAHELVGYDPSIHPATMRIGTDTALGHVLQHTIGAIFQKLDFLTDAEAPAIAEGLIALLRKVLFANPEIAEATSEFGAARAGAIRSFIDRSIGSDQLSADTICARFNVSRSTLYRDFKGEGGLDRFVLGRRLEATLHQLASVPGERGIVTRTAEQWGFSSTSYFSREFRRKFGCAPSDVIGAPFQTGSERDVEIGKYPDDKRNMLEHFMRRL